MIPKYKYIGGLYKVSISIEKYRSFKYPSDQFIPTFLDLYSIGYTELGKRKQLKIRGSKRLTEVLKKLRVDPLKVKDFLVS